MRQLSDQKKITLNISMTIIAAMATAGLHFFLSPFIVRTIGVDANGFIQLAANFTTYAALATLALNSVAGRFITIAAQQGDKKKAGQYYTSVFWGNCIIVLVLVLPAIFVIVFLENIINIPAHLVSDVQLLFTFVFLHFFATSVFSLWSNSFFIANRPYLQSMGTALATVIQAVAIFSLFSIFESRVFYPALASIASIAFIAIWSLFHKNRLIPELKVKKRLLSLTRLREMISSGIWRSVQSLGDMLLTGLNLLICNLFLGPVMMGVFALSKTIPTILMGLNWQIAATFAPQLTIQYAKGNSDGIKSEMKRACKISALVGTIPLAILLVYGEEFFALWVPSQDAEMLHILSVVICFGHLIVAGMQPLNNSFVTVNKMKPLSFSVIISGIVNIIAILVLLNFTDFGIYAIAGTSTMILIVRNVTFTFPAATNYLGYKWYTFFIGFGYSIAGSLITMAIGFAIKFLLGSGGWLLLIVCCAATGLLSFITIILAIFSKDEKKQLWRKICTLKKSKHY